MILVIQFLLLFAIPVITVALFLLMFQREFDATFFNVDAGADPLLWQHLFWIFGHPEVYILVLPSFGIVSEVLPVFSKKPLFGYPFVVFSGAAIGFVGWGVWAHHMFASGLGPVSVAVFSVATMAIAIPTGVKIVNWTLTMWGGKLRFTTAMLFAIGLIVEFTIGGLSGVTHAVAPSDTQQTDTYYIVAHFHYVLFGGAVLGFFAGFYYWWPKVFGKCLSEKLGKWNFWLMIIGMNLTFGPMHIIGLQGQPRRMYVWTEARAGEGFFNLGFWNRSSSIGAFILAIGVLLFLDQRVPHHAQGGQGAARPVGRPHARVDDDQPAEGAQLRRRSRRCTPSTSSSTASTKTSARATHHDFRQVATAEEILAEQEAHADSHIHMPSPSYWPLSWRCALPIIGFGVIFNHADRRSWRRRSLVLGAVRLGARAVGRRRLRLRPAAARRRRRYRAARWPGETTWLTRRWSIEPRRRCTTSTADDGTVTATARHEEHGTDRAVQQQDGHVAVPRVGVPAVRRADLAPTCSTAAATPAASAPTRSTTSRSRRCRASCC